MRALKSLIQSSFTYESMDVNCVVSQFKTFRLGFREGFLRKHETFRNVGKELRQDYERF